MSLSSKIVSNTLISYAGRAVSIAFALIIVGLITRSLGQEGFGEYVTVLAFLSLFVILADLGLHSLMTREISREEDSGPASLFFLLFGFGAAFLFPYTIEVKLGIGIGALGFFFLSVHQLLLGVFQKHLAMHLAALAEIAGRGAQLLFVFLIYLIASATIYSQYSIWSGKIL